MKIYKVELIVATEDSMNIQNLYIKINYGGPSSHIIKNVELIKGVDFEDLKEYRYDNNLYPEWLERADQELNNL